VVAQPGGFYGGWITGDVVGPFKGEPGSWVGEGGRSPGSTSLGEVAVVDMREELARNTADIEQSGDHW